MLKTPSTNLTWLKDIKAGDLVHICNGSFYELYPIALITKVVKSSIHTRWLEDFIWCKTLKAMQKTLNAERHLELVWSSETSLGLSELRSHNFLLPIEVSSFSRWIAQDKEATTTDLYVPPNITDLHSLRTTLKNNRN